jgi:hypothetical protein
MRKKRFYFDKNKEKINNCRKIVYLLKSGETCFILKYDFVNSVKEIFSFLFF